MDSLPMTLPTWESCLRTKWAYIMFFLHTPSPRVCICLVKQPPEIVWLGLDQVSDPASTPCVKTYEQGHKAKRLYCVISRHFKALQWALHQEV